ncbi:MAG: GNAT family N-acetyltransferase [Bacteroidota bacterium]|nr:GNAT family N-acetyltransferase [Bacteroidota bacterium]
MSVLLDNPIWHALSTGNQPFSLGNETVKYMQREVGIFAGLKTNSKDELTVLHEILPPESSVILFTPNALPTVPGWKIQLQRELLQMVYTAAEEPPLLFKHPIIPLQEKDVPSMLALTKLTKPGPFFSRTFELGNYEGVFCNGNLVAMTGQRLQPYPFTEVSAVCTHPDHTGKGYAAGLLTSQIKKILAERRIPFLHVYPNNVSACKLYEKLGFSTRKSLIVQVLEKE